MAGHGNKITRRMELAIAALLEAPTLPLAARQAGVSERTLANWLKDEVFQAAYRRARGAVLEHAITKLQKAATKAAETLERNLDCGHGPTEIKAAGLVLDHATRLKEVLDHEERLKALEKQRGK